MSSILLQKKKLKCFYGCTVKLFQFFKLHSARLCITKLSYGVFLLSYLVAFLPTPLDLLRLVNLFRFKDLGQDSYI